MIGGGITVNGERMETGAAAQIRDEPQMRIEAATDSDLILIEAELT